MSDKQRIMLEEEIEIVNFTNTNEVEEINVSQEELHLFKPSSAFIEQEVKVKTKIADPFPGTATPDEETKTNASQGVENMADRAIEEVMRRNFDGSALEEYRTTPEFDDNKSLTSHAGAQLVSIDEVLETVKFDNIEVPLPDEIEIEPIEEVVEDIPLPTDVITPTEINEDVEIVISTPEATDLTETFEIVKESNDSITEDNDESVYDVSYDFDTSLDEFDTKEEVPEAEESIQPEEEQKAVRKFKYENIDTEGELSSLRCPMFTEDEASEFMQEIELIIDSVKRKEDITDEYTELGKSLRNPKSVVHKAYNTAREFFTAGREFERSIFKQRLDESPNNTLAHAAKLNGVKYSHPTAGKGAVSAIPDGTIISNKDKSIKTLAALISGIRKVYLPHSGFWVELKAPDLSQLLAFDMSCGMDTEKPEWGRLLGGVMYAHRDLRIKQATLELIKNCVIGSNLVGYKSGTTFEDNLSILDMDTCLWGIATLLYPKGNNVTFTCFGQECNHSENVRIELQHLIYTDYTRLGTEALKFLYDPKSSRNDIDLTEYRENILGIEKEYDLDSEGIWKAKLTIPTVSTVLKYGSEFLADMMSAIHIENVLDAELYSIANKYRSFLPYVKTVYYKDAGSNKTIGFTDLGTYINTLSNDSSIKLVDTLEKHIGRNTLCFFGYPYTACPKCGKTPDEKLPAIPVDMFNTFFIVVEEKKNEMLLA